MSYRKRKSAPTLTEQKNSEPWEDPPQEKERRQGNCVIHFENTKHGNLVLFSELKDPQERWTYIQKVKHQRISEPEGSTTKMANICEQIPENFGILDGYHRNCYSRFTCSLNRLKSSNESTTVGELLREKKHRTSKEKILFDPDCIFCNKSGRIHVKKGRNRTKESTTIFECEGWKTVIRIAEENNDENLLLRIRGYDLFACEARYHPSCRRKYTMKPEYWRSQDNQSVAAQTALEDAHKSALHHVVAYVKEHVIEANKVIQLSCLTLMYTAELENTPFKNPKYQGAKRLKPKLENHPDLNGKIQFIKCNPANSQPFFLLYNTKITVGDAISEAYSLATTDSIREVALLLRGIIMKSFRESKELSWPPSANELEITSEVIPNQLRKFLSIAMDKQIISTSDHANRLILSVGQDICRAVTNGEWKLPKHILLCMTLRHLYRSKLLLTLLNRFGHCESNSFAMELESAVDTALEQKSTVLTNQIVKAPYNVVFHSEWDNFNQHLTGIHGAPFINTAGGIMLQEVQGTYTLSQSASLPTVSRSSLVKKQDPPLSLPAFHVSRRQGPVMNLEYIDEPIENKVAFAKGQKFYLIWILCRKACATGKQTVPAFGGFISATGIVPLRRTTIDNYPWIPEPITEYNVVKELLKRCEQATKEVGQLYTITTFDLGVCMKALPLIWDNPAEYKNHIVLIGAFHIIMNYLNMIGHKMAGSGYAELLIEAGLVTSGCVGKVLSGKRYSKALWSLKVVSESFERLLLQSFIDMQQETEGNAEALNDLITSMTPDNMANAIEDKSISEYLDKYIKFQEEVRKGSLGKTAQFWMSFLDDARLVFLIIYAVKTNSLPLFHKTLGDMADLFFSFGGQNYARYLSWFYCFLLSIEESHPGASELLRKGAISVARSLIPGNLCAVDKTMEETFMKFAKSRGGAGGAGLSGMLNNYGAYQRWIRTASERTKYYEATLEMAGMIGDEDSIKNGKHRELCESEIKRSEDAVQRTLDTIQGWLNPFKMTDKDKLCNISSGACVPPDIEKDVLQSEKIGKEAKIAFMQERLMKGEHGEHINFFDRVPRLKLKTMEKTNKQVKLTTSQGNVIKYQEQGDIAFQILIKSQQLSAPFSLEELMAYSITAIPHAIGTPDGFLFKTNKAALVNYLLRDAEPCQLPNDEILCIIDGNAMLHSLKDIPPTFKDTCLKILDQLSNKKNVIFSTDMYLQESPKSHERRRRGSSGKLILEGINMRTPSDFKLFLQNNDNKAQLFRIMLKVWKSDDAASRLKGKNIVIIVDGKAYSLTSHDGHVVQQEEISALESSQEETDSRTVLYLLHAKENNFAHALVQSPDSDLFFIILHYATKLRPLTVLFDTGSGAKRRLINMTNLADDFGEGFCTTLLGIYIYTGEDCTSAFRGKGKVTPFKKLQQMPKYHNVFKRLGESWEVDIEMAEELEHFTCVMYGYPR